MPVFTLPDHIDPLRRHLANSPTDTGLVACFCAAWCDTCRDYAPAFAQLADKFPQYVFIWVDIEENPELLGDEDVENFPTLLVQTATENRFFGPMLPHIGHLEKLLVTINRMPAINGGPPLLRQTLTAQV